MDQWCKSRNNSYRTAPAEADGIEEERRGIRGKELEERRWRKWRKWGRVEDERGIGGEERKGKEIGKSRVE